MTGMNFELSPEGQSVLKMFQKLRKENVTPRALKHDKRVSDLYNPMNAPGVSRLFQVCGARAAADAPQNGLDLFWRNARTFTLHDPVDYRRQRIGKYLLGVEDPPIGWY